MASIQSEYAQWHRADQIRAAAEQAAKSALAQYITIQEFCDLTHTPYSTARKWIKSGKLPAFSGNGRDLRIRVSDIEKVMRPVGTTEGTQ